MTIMNTDRALGAQSLLQIMARSLPRTTGGETPLLQDRYSAAGLFAHACMIAVGFRLRGLGDDHQLGMNGQDNS